LTKEEAMVIMAAAATNHGFNESEVEVLRIRTGEKWGDGMPFVQVTSEGLLLSLTHAQLRDLWGHIAGAQCEGPTQAEDIRAENQVWVSIAISAL
jgi:hypothetical protein